MAIEIYKEPAPVVFSGNHILFGVKDTGLLGSNVEQHCIYAMHFTQGVTGAYALKIDRGSEQYYFQNGSHFPTYYKNILPLKDGAESLTDWVTRLADILRGDLDLNSALYAENAGEYIYLIEKEVLGDITFELNVYITDPDGSEYCEHAIAENSSSVNYGQFHAIGIKPEKHIDVNLSTPGGTIDSVPSDYGDGIEPASEVNYTDETEPYTKITDGSMHVEADVHELVKFKAAGHFDITAASVVRNLAKKFSMYFYIVKGTPKVRESGKRSGTFMVIDAETTRTMQARLNAMGKSIFQHLADELIPLTWAPDNKVIDIYQPERIYHLMMATVVDAKFRITEYFSDDTTATSDVLTFSAQQYQVIELSAAFMDVRSDSGKTVTKYEVWIENAAAEIILAVRTYIMSYEFQPYARWWMVKNGFGVYECLRTTGKAIISGDIIKEFIDKELPLNYLPTDREREQVSSSTKLLMKTGTGPLDKVWAKYSLELFDSKDVYLMQQGNPIPADIQADEFVFERDGENINTHTFEAFLTDINEEQLDTSITLPITGEFTKDFDEGFLIGT